MRVVGLANPAIPPAVVPTTPPATLSYETAALLSFMGVVVELGGAVMLIALFAVLRRYALRRGYFGAWTWAWSAIAVAIAALVVRYYLMPGLVESPMEETHLVNWVLYLVYQVGKLSACLCFITGVRMYVGRGSGGLPVWRVWAGLLVFALVSIAGSPSGLNQVVVWQSPVDALGFGYCAMTLMGLPPSRRTLGTTTAGVGFALLAALWLVYGISFSAVLAHTPALPLMAAVVSYNTYSDLLLNLFLGYGLVLIVMEDAKREVDDARAELHVAHDRMQRAALYDSLTESLNRRAYIDGVGLEMVRATFGAVVLADVDDLKAVNDKYGHAAGDKLLRHCASALRQVLRPYDKLYRWGGDEFLLIMPSARAADVQKRLQHVLDVAEAAGVDSTVSRLRVSLGAADYAGAEALEEAIDRADYLMYREKNRRKVGGRRLSPAPVPVT